MNWKPPLEPSLYNLEQHPFGSRAKRGFPFAWYTASGAASLAQEQSGANTTITAENVSLNVTTAYRVNFSVTESSQKALVLSEAVTADATTSLVTYFVDAQGYAIAASQTDYSPTDKVLSKKFAVSAKLQKNNGTAQAPDWQDVTLSAAADLAEFHAINTTVTAVFTASAQDSATTPVAHLAHVAPCAENTAEGSYIADAEVTFSINPSTSPNNSWDGASKVVGYFLLRVDGNSATTTIGSTAQVTTGNVSVTISAGSGN